MRAAASTAAVGMALLLSGCSGNDAAPPAAATVSSASASASASSSAPAAAAVAPTERSTVTGSRRVKGSSGAALQVDVRGLHRDGKLLRLDYTVTNISPERLFVPDVMPPDNLTDIFLLDTEGLKKYLVVRDSKNEPAYQRPSLYLQPQDVFDGAAYFAAPPAGVERLRLNSAALGTFDTPVT